MVPPSVQRPKLSVLFSGSRPPKLSVYTTINYLVHFGLITAETNSLERFFWSHYPFWMIHNFSSDNFSFYDNQWKLIPMRPPSPSSIPLLQRMLIRMFTWANIKKNVVNFRRNLSTHPVVLPQYNYQKIMVPPIILLRICQ